MRGGMIAAGSFLLARFHWILYIFGGFLVLTAIRMATQEEKDIEPEANPVIRLVRRFMPIASDYDGQNFFTRLHDGKRAATPLFVVLLLVETTDLIFAVDSIPAIFAVTQDPFLVYTSNVFAILGLRALYFLLADVVTKFEYLKVGLAVILGFVGVKLLLVDVYKIPIGASLGVIALILLGSIVASVLWSKPSAHPERSHPPEPVTTSDPSGFRRSD
jgi:tellurite resistance protein TerC